MSIVQRYAAFACAIALGGLLVAPAAHAKPKSKLTFNVAPAAPTLKTPIEVSFKAPKALRGARFVVDIGIRNPDALACTAGLRVAASTRGRNVTAKLKPLTGNVPANGPGVWCPGKAQIRVFRKSALLLKLASRELDVKLAPGESQPTESYIPAKITVLGGSTLTASAAGRPDRSSQLTGVLRGKISGRFKPNTDVLVTEMTGSLTPFSSSLTKAIFPPDPLCPDTAPPATFDALAASQMALPASGDAKATLVLNGGPSQLFGCGPGGALAGTTTLTVSGHVGPKGLQELHVAGDAGAISLPGGSTGGLAASLALNVDLSGVTGP